ncbi:MAG TPA: hypothetical protein VMY76_16485 [Gemmatimonadales bacterium]|nr:hypothetical protein [Gemmatimonadales bacterium]
MRPYPLARLAALLLAAACGEQRAPAPVLTFDPTKDTIPTALAEVTAGVWLGGDRWALLAAPDEQVVIADAAARTVTRLGTATELRNPVTLFRAGDTLYVGDWGLRRTSRWTLEGRFAGAVPTSDAVRGVLPRARDAAGRFYLELTPRPGPDGRGNRDSAAVVVAAPPLDRPDTIALLAPLDIAEVTSDAGRRFERRVFSGADQWGALADGSLWLARVYDNRLDWRDPSGTWVRGEPLPDRVLEVTRYDRELFLRRFPPELRGTAQQLPFAPIKPPFEAALTGPDGNVWLEKSRAPVDSSRRYHLVDRRGRLRTEIRVPGPGRIIAVAAAALLVAEPSREGVRLLRFSMPAAPPSSAP